jgi:hypothetical protein
MNLRQEAKNAIKKLKYKGYEISNIMPILGSANSTVYKINTRKDNFFLKIYPNEELKYDQTSRFTRETNFLAYLNTALIKNTPKLVYKSEKDQVILTSWVNGDEIKKISINSLRAMVNFTAECNKNSHIIDAQRITQAKDSWRSSSIAVNDIRSRWENLMTGVTNDKKKMHEVQEFLKVRNLSEMIKHEVDLFEKKTSKCHWQTSTIKQILSQSDMSINNTKRDGCEFSFFDFEYAGWDDPAKLATDILCHPDHNLSHEDEIQCIVLMREKNIFMDQGVEERIMDSRTLAKIKWLLIMCKIYINDRSGTWGMQKIKEYSDKILPLTTYLQGSENSLS